MRQGPGGVCKQILLKQVDGDWVTQGIFFVLGVSEVRKVLVGCCGAVSPTTGEKPLRPVMSPSKTTIAPCDHARPSVRKLKVMP